VLFTPSLEGRGNTSPANSPSPRREPVRHVRAHPVQDEARDYFRYTAQTLFALGHDGDTLDTIPPTAAAAYTRTTRMTRMAHRLRHFYPSNNNKNTGAGAPVAAPRERMGANKARQAVAQVATRRGRQRAE
jgi:hypothetical protein